MNLSQKSVQSKALQTLILVFSAAVVLATSTARDYTEPVLVWLVNSTCSGSLPSEVISTQGSIIVSPANRNFTMYGLPTANIRIGVDKTLTGNDGVTTRDCIHSTVDLTGTPVETYTCADNLVPACIVSFQKN